MNPLSASDKAGQSYWDRTWEGTEIPASFDPHDTALDNTFYVRVHEYFEKVIAGRRGLKILEIGCAHSVWPQYFTRYHDALVDGIDYSETGCRKSREMWGLQRLPGQIICADIYNPPASMLGQYDLVVSFGVVEHFEDTAACLRACAAFVKPGGQMFTMIPNMAGIVGLLQKYVDRDVYDIHVPLSCRALGAAHQKAGLEVQDIRNFMSLNLGVVNSGRHAGRPFDRILRRALSGPSKIVWALERAGLRLPENAATSPYVFALARV